jgi:DNA-binding IclR family transcriptional regulator
VTDLVKQDVASRNTASRYLRELADNGVLEQKKEGREILYINTRFLDLLKSDKHAFLQYPPVNAKTPAKQGTSAP